MTHRAPLIRILTQPSHLYKIATLSLVGGFINVVFFSIAIHLDILGAGDIVVNGLVFSAICTACVLLSLPYASRMRRKAALVVG